MVPAGFKLERNWHFTPPTDKFIVLVNTKCDMVCRHSAATHKEEMECLPIPF